MSLMSGPLWPDVLGPELPRIEAETLRLVGAHRCRRLSVSVGSGPVLAVTVWPRRGEDLADEVLVAVEGIVAGVAGVVVVVTVAGVV